MAFNGLQTEKIKTGYMIYFKYASNYSYCTISYSEDRCANIELTMKQITVGGHEHNGKW